MMVLTQLLQHTEQRPRADAKTQPDDAIPQ